MFVYFWDVLVSAILLSRKVFPKIFRRIKFVEIYRIDSWSESLSVSGGFSAHELGSGISRKDNSAQRHLKNRGKMGKKREKWGKIVKK
jgi:hypothetical protein